MFGGHVEEGESPEEALLREIKEELDIVPTGCEFFRHYELPDDSRDVYALRVGDDFEKSITILEGQYGKWFTEDEIEQEEKVSDNSRTVLKDFFRS